MTTLVVGHTYLAELLYLCDNKKQNPDIVLVHYLNVPYPDDNKMAVIAPSITLWGDKKEWTKEELVSQLKPMREYNSCSS